MIIRQPEEFHIEADRRTFDTDRLSGKTIFNRPISRAGFLRYSARYLALGFIEPNVAFSRFFQLPPDFRQATTTSTGDLFSGLLPNSRVTMTNLSYVPSSPYYQHLDTERLSGVFNAKDTYNPDSTLNPKHLDLSKTIGVWKGIQEAIQRKQIVNLVVEMPYNVNCSKDDWRQYIGTIAANFNGARFIIDNELNAPGYYWGNNINEYADNYIIAAQEIRRYPASSIFPYGDAYFGEGETLSSVLDTISQKRGGSKLSEIIDGIVFHFYDTSTKLPNRVNLYQSIAQRYQLPAMLQLTELGKAEEAFNLTDPELKYELQRQLLIQNLAVALALSDQALIDSIVWHTGYTKVDPNEHSLTIIDPDYEIAGYKPAYAQLWKMSKLLHHNVSIEIDNTATVVKAKTSQDQDVVIAWNNMPVREDFPDWMCTAEARINLFTSVYMHNFDDRIPADIILPRTNRNDVDGKPAIFVFDKNRIVYSE